jgi:16S rRNA processing protein RimM
VAAGTSARILLGRTLGAHGVRGEVLIKTYTQAPASIGAYGALTDASGVRRFTIKVVRVTPKGVVARIGGITSRDAAEALQGVEFFVERNRLPQAGEGEFYYADLVGLTAVDGDNRVIGTVVAVHNFGAGDLLEVRLDGSAKTELVPFADRFVPTVEVKAGRIVVILPGASDADQD